MDGHSRRLVWIGVGMVALGLLSLLITQAVISNPDHIAPDGEMLASNPIPVFGFVFQGFILAAGLVMFGLGLLRQLIHKHVEDPV